jgi:hypothetical protein
VGVAGREARAEQGEQREGQQERRLAKRRTRKRTVGGDVFGERKLGRSGAVVNGR